MKVSELMTQTHLECSLKGDNFLLRKQVVRGLWCAHPLISREQGAAPLLLLQGLPEDPIPPTQILDPASPVTHTDAQLIAFDTLTCSSSVAAPCLLAGTV